MLEDGAEIPAFGIHLQPLPHVPVPTVDAPTNVKKVQERLGKWDKEAEQAWAAGDVPPGLSALVSKGNSGPTKEEALKAILDR